MSKDATIGQELLLRTAIAIALSITFASWVVSIARHAAENFDKGPAGYEQRLDLRGTSGLQDLAGRWPVEGSGDNAPAGPPGTHSSVVNDLTPIAGFGTGGE